MRKKNNQIKTVSFSKIVKVKLFILDQKEIDDKKFWLIDLRRFERRIEKFEEKAKYIFSKLHREYIFLSRFDNNEYIKDICF